MKFKKILIMLSLSIASLALVGCGGSSDSSNTNTNQTQSEEKSTSSESDDTSKADVETKTEYALGETVDIKGKQLTVLEVAKSPGLEYDSPKEGHEFIIVTVKYDNNSEKDINYNSFDFELLNSQGQKTDSTFTTVGNETRLESGSLAPGGTVTGTVTFEAPVGDEGLYLIYKENLFSEKEIKIKL